MVLIVLLRNDCIPVRILVTLVVTLVLCLLAILPAEDGTARDLALHHGIDSGFVFQLGAAIDDQVLQVGEASESLGEFLQ